MDHAVRGTAAFEAKDFSAALVHYTKALLESPISPDYYAKRSAAFTRLSPARHDLALKDAEYSVLCAEKRAVRDKISAGQFRRMIALHGLGRYADAKAVLETTKKWLPESDKKKKMEYDMWMAKINNKLKTVPDEQQVSNEKETPNVSLPGDNAMKKWLRAQLNADGTYNFNPDTTAQDDEMPDAPAEDTKDRNGTAAPTSTATVSAPSQIHHDWYQSPTTVTVTIYVKGVSKSACEIEIEEDSVHVSFPQPSDPNATYNLTLDPLFALIIPTGSKSSVMSTKIELVLKKTQAGQKWHTLEGTAPLKQTSPSKEKDWSTPPDVKSILTASSNGSAAAPAEEKAPAYPTSSRTGPKNWDKVASAELKKVNKKPKTDDDKDPKEDEDMKDDNDADSDPDDVDGFFKRLYKGSDDDTRRAMMKSMYESNGTSLSTNWKDVGSRHVDEVKDKDDKD
jgi:suppressor of G2 allele of SKP1